jgi:hypothetical protein
MNTNADNRMRLGFDPKLSELRNLLPEIVDTMERGLGAKTYGFAYLSSSKQKAVVVHRMEASHSVDDLGIVLRLVHHGKNFETATNVLDRKNLIDAARRLRALAKKDKVNGESYPFYTPRQWKDESLATLDDEIASQIPKSPDASTVVHFSPLVSADPLGVDMKELTDRARELRNSVIERDKSYCAKTGKEPLANVVVSLRVTVETHVFRDRCKNR